MVVGLVGQDVLLLVAVVLKLAAVLIQDLLMGELIVLGLHPELVILKPVHQP